jgi:hypothetical protein
MNLPTSLPGGVQLKRRCKSESLSPTVIELPQLLTSLFGMGPFRFVEWPDRAESKYYYRGEPEQIR